MNNTNRTIEELTEIFVKHKEERICVIGTTCCGKTTLLRKIPGCVDMDDELFSRLTKEEADFVCQTPWTEEIGDEFDRLVYERVKIKPGQPMFGTVILDCDAVVYLDIDDDMLKDRCEKRGVSFEDAKNMERAIKGDWDNNKAKNGRTNYWLKITE